MKIEELSALFLEFVLKVKQNVCKVVEEDYIAKHRTNVDWNVFDPVNHEKLFKMMWDRTAPTWASVEKDSTYTQTIMCFIERLSKLPNIQGRKLRIVSLGSGPGLYEIFLAYWLRSIGRNARIFSIDYSDGMIEFQKKLLSSDMRIGDTRLSVLANHVTPVVGDMEDLRRFAGCADIVLCNNSLQWVKDWRAAVREMSLCLNKDGLKIFIAVVHPHPMKVNVEDRTIERPFVSDEDLLDGLELNKIQPVFQRYISGTMGTGQGGGQLNRMYLEASLKPNGIRTTWREMIHTPRAPRFVKL